MKLLTIGLMRPVTLPATLALKLDSRTREAIEKAAHEARQSMGAFTRELISEGLAARGLA